MDNRPPPTIDQLTDFKRLPENIKYYQDNPDPRFKNGAQRFLFEIRTLMNQNPKYYRWSTRDRLRLTDENILKTQNYNLLKEAILLSYADIVATLLEPLKEPDADSLKAAQEISDIPVLFTLKNHWRYYFLSYLHLD